MADAKKSGSEGLRSLLATVDKAYGKNTMMLASEASGLKLERVPMGIPVLDLAIGGGLPRGRIVLLKGEFSTGKSWQALRAAAQFQRRCRVCGKVWEKIDLLTGELSDPDCRCTTPQPMEVMWVDLEGVFDPPWSKRQGVRLEHCHVIRPAYAEQGIDVTDLVIRSHECDLVVVDSVAALTPSTEVEESTEKWQMGLQARLVNKAMRKWTSGLNAGGLDDIRGKPTVLLINQVRVKLGVMFGNPETTPGGKGQEFHSSIIVQLSRKGFLREKSDGEEVTVGQQVSFYVAKNKTSTPHRSGVFDFYFADAPSGFKAGDVDLSMQMLALGLRYGFLEKRGSFVANVETGKTLAQGEAAASKKLAEDLELRTRIWEKACLAELGYVP